MASPHNASLHGRCFELYDPYDRCPLYLSNSTQLYAVTVGSVVANILTAPISIIANFIIISVMYTTPSLHTPADVLLGNLAFADFLTGLLSQPTFAGFLIWEIVHGKISCTLWYFTCITGFISSGLAFFSLTGISLERYMALFFHLRYEDVVTPKVAIASVVSIWFINLAIVSLWIVETLRYFVRLATFTFTVFCFAITCAAHLKILKVALRHRQQIQAGSISNSRTSQLKLAVSMAYIVWIYVICYTPYFIACIYSAFLTTDSCTAKLVFELTGTLAYLVAAVEPFVFCWRNRKLRTAVADSIRRMVGVSLLPVNCCRKPWVHIQFLLLILVYSYFSKNIFWQTQGDINIHKVSTM